jgi:hypothetical protein
MGCIEPAMFRRFERVQKHEWGLAMPEREGVNLDGVLCERINTNPFCFEQMDYVLDRAFA